MDAERLKQRGIGRTEAQAIIDLCNETAVNLPSPDAIAAFCDSIQEYAAKSAPPDPPNPFDAMDAEEARDFAQEEMPFGKFKGTAIGECDNQYLDWLVGENESFMRRLARYMKSEKVAEELRVSLEIQDR